MKSPKYKFNHDEIAKVIQPTILKNRWKSLGKQLRRQALVDFCEYKDIDSDIEILCKDICDKFARAQYRPFPVHYYLLEKSRGLCRQMALPRPEDLLVLEAITAYLKTSIVDGRPTKNSFFEPESAKFTKLNLQKKLAVDEYSGVAAWKKFQQAIFAFSKENPFIVVTDVANFYDFIRFDHLRNIIASICNTKEEVLDILIYILNEMTWNPDFMPRAQVGLPQMESNAPRVLANAMLYELDRVATEHAFGDYVRFMDDSDVVVRSIPAAKAVIRDIDLTLQSRQLRLNSSKTKILNARNGEASDHFCIKENKFLDHCVDIVGDGSSSFKNGVVRRALDRAYKLWVRPSIIEGRFGRGNGSKVFKYLVKIAKEVGYDVPERDLIRLIRIQPSLRDVAFAALSWRDKPNTAFYEIARFFKGGLFVDDYCYLQIAYFIVHTRFRANQKFSNEVKELVDFFIQEGTIFSIYAAFMIQSKILEPYDILVNFDKTFAKWRQDYWLGRAVAGTMPRFFGTGDTEAEYFKITMRASSNFVDSVTHFHNGIVNKKS